MLLPVVQRHAGDVAGGMAEVGHERSHRALVHRRDDDRDRVRGGRRGPRAARCPGIYHVRLPCDEFRRQFRQALDGMARRTDLQRNVFSIDIVPRGASASSLACY
jgi:hypothetical protein